MKDNILKVEFNNSTYDVKLIIKNTYITKFKIEGYDTIVLITRNKMNEKEISELLEKNKEKLIKALSKPRIIKKSNEMVILGNIINRRDYFDEDLDKLKEDAFNQIEETFNRIQKEFPKVSVYYHKMKSRWGVCYPAKKRIGLSTYLVHVPLHLTEYVIYHEFCHLKYPNHSALFYKELEKYVPNHKELKKELKLYSTLL